MIRTAYFACHLPRAEADALNAESGRIYSQVVVEQYRIYRKKGIWLSKSVQARYSDFLNEGRPRLLHAHSGVPKNPPDFWGSPIDAAQQGFAEACQVAKANRALGAKYPYRRKRYRTTVWKHTAIRLRGECLLLSRARVLAPIAYKAQAAGITVNDEVDEAYTSQTCAACGQRHKLRGRMCLCPACGALVHRDVQRAANILSRFLYAELARVPVVAPKYRHPVLRGKRSSGGHPASSSRQRELRG